MLWQFDDRLVGQRETFPRQGENVIDQAGIAGFAIQQGLKVGLKCSVRFRVRSAITSSALGLRTSSSRSGARSSSA